MSASGAGKAPEMWDPTLMHKIAMTGPGMATIGQLPIVMTIHTGGSQTTDGPITETGAPTIVPAFLQVKCWLAALARCAEAGFALGRWPQASIWVNRYNISSCSTKVFFGFNTQGGGSRRGEKGGGALCAQGAGDSVGCCGL